MAIDWKIWAFFVFLAVCSIGLLAEGVIRLRIGHGASWKAIGLCALAMVLCIGGNTGMYFLYSSNGSMLELLKNPPGPSHLEPHWGANMSREDRTKYSQLLARTSFENWGITVNYFDDTGALRPYQATDADRARLQWRRQAIAHYEKTTNLLAWITFGWLFNPWLGLLAAFVPSTARVLGALTGRSKVDALQPGSAPLNQQARSAMAQLTCCKNPSWVAGRDLGEAGGFDFLLGKCGACGAPWMNVFCTAASTSGYEHVTAADLAAIQSITDVNELKKFMRQWGNKNL